MQGPIRILQVGMSPNYGGTEAFLMEQYRHIDKEKIQFDFLNVFQEELACASEILALGGRILNLDMARHRGMRSYRSRLNAFFKEHHRELAGIHCNCQSLINIDLLKYAKRYHIPVRIVHAHNAGYGKKPSLLQRALILKNKWTVKRYATHFFACSSLAAKWMFPKRTKATVIRNGIDVTKFDFDASIRSKKRSELQLAEDTLAVLFVGRLDPQKNPLFLIEIFERLASKHKNAKLLMAGDGDMRGDIEALVEKKGLFDKVQLLGNRSDISELMQAADAFLLPSLFEGLGIVLIEAQATALPCFTSRDAVPQEVDITNTVHFISLDSPAEAWSECILCHSSVLQDRRGKGEMIAEKGYDSKKEAFRLQKIYRDILA